MKMKPAARVPFILTWIVVIPGIIIFQRVARRTGQLPMRYFIPWIIVSVVLIAISIWFWRRSTRT